MKKKPTTYDVGNLGSGLGQEQKYGWIKPVYVIPNPLLIVVSPTAMYVKTAIVEPILCHL